MTQDERRVWIRIYQRQRRRDAVKLGICQVCCKNKPEPGRKTYRVCIDRARTWEKNHENTK